MLYKNHIPFAAASWIACATAAHVAPVVVLGGVVVAAMAGLAPDLDTPESWAGRRLRVLSVPLGMVFGHRGITHSILALGLCLWGCMHLFAGHVGLATYVVAPLAVGYASHVVADMFNPSGAPLLWPYPRHFRFPLLHWRCGNLIEYVVAWGVLAWSVWFAMGHLAVRVLG